MGIAATPLARPIHIGHRLAKNRFLIQPMECCDATLSGSFSEDTLRRYDALFRGGAGVVVMESVTLQYKSRSTRHQLLLDPKDPLNRAAWEDFVRDKKLHYPNTLLLVQLTHSGELSNDRFSERVCVKPHPNYGGTLIDEDYIDQIIHDYAEACRFLAYIGVDGVDLKFCHGYLGSQLVRPYNDRRWKYGGSFENRSRFAYDLIERVRFIVPHESFLLGAKVSIFDEMPGGQGHAGPNSAALDLAESVQFCKGLEFRGANFIIETLGGVGCGWNLMSPSKKNPEAVHQHIAAARLLRKNLKPETTVICSGLSLLRNGENNGLPDEDLFQMGNDCIKQGDFDMIGLGRQSFADPLLPRKYLEDNINNINWCTCCNCCSTLFGHEQHTGCVLYNPPYTKAYCALKSR